MLSLIKKIFNVKPVYSVCKECGVHFEPAPKHEARWGHLCSVHRAPVMEGDLHKDAVIHWAHINWREVEPLYEKYQDRERAAREARCACSQDSIAEIAKRSYANAQSEPNALNAGGFCGPIFGGPISFGR